METLSAEDDISILNREEASPEATPFRYSPIAGSSGDESVGSHFALVTAYEDIKKRLKQTESENSFLKKKVRMLEERLLNASLDNEKTSFGQQEVNKAYQAYREVCIEREKMRQRLERMIKEQMDSVRILNETLQAKEVEILQLRSQVETLQVMDNLNRTHNSWDSEKSSNELKVHTLNQEMEILKQECNFLRQELQNYKQKESSLDACVPNQEVLKDEKAKRYAETLVRACVFHQDCQIYTMLVSIDRYYGQLDTFYPQPDRQPLDDNFREVGLQMPYQDLKREMLNLHLVTKTQAELLQKLLATHGSSKNVQSLDDLFLDCGKLELNSSGTTYHTLHPLSKEADVKMSKFATTYRFQQDTGAYCDLVPWASSRPTPVGSAALEENVSCGKASIDDNSWVLPNPPLGRPSDAAFWKTGSTSGSSAVKIPVVNIHDPFILWS